ncbi:transposase [Streptomyces mirabilis]|uniref:transposase n=1 Tax=Streptomyces mirabilis TaxID=68239 RepID=UPI0033C4FF5B
MRHACDCACMWVGSGGESAKTSMAWFAKPKNRGTEEVLTTCCCDGLKGLADSIQNIWPLADIQLYAASMVRNSLKYASPKCWVYTAATVEAAEHRFAKYEEIWGACCPTLNEVWRPAAGNTP